MNRLENAAQLSSATSKMMQRGVMTNIFFTPEQLAHHITEGQIYFSEGDNSLVVLTTCKVNHLYCMMLPGGILPALSLPPKSVCEFAYKGNTPDELFDELCRTGFLHSVNRIRLAIRSADIVCNNDVRFAVAEDVPHVLSVLEECFDSLTGCIPSHEDLIRDISDNLILLHSSGGVLRFKKSGKTCELCHLAVPASARRQGAASALLDTFLRTPGGSNFRLWVREDNYAAQALYNKFGFTADGFKSAVYTYEG